MKKLINVTQDDINKGIANRHTVKSITATCPNALALSRELGEPCNFGTKRWWKRVDNDNVENWKKAPKEAIDFAYNVDVGNPVAPYSFEVEV